MSAIFENIGIDPGIIIIILLYFMKEKKILMW